MAKVNSITKHTCVAYWELTDFLDVSEKPSKQTEMEGHTTFSCLKSQLNVDASFIYSPQSSKMKLNVSFQTEASKNMPERIIISLEGQSYVFNPKEEGQWKTMEFKYLYERKYPEGMRAWDRIRHRNKWRPRTPAFNFFIDFPEEEGHDQGPSHPENTETAVTTV